MVIFRLMAVKRLMTLHIIKRLRARIRYKGLISHVNLKKIMRVTLFHNPTAGKEETTKEELLQLLNKAGHAVDYQSTDEDDYKDALEDPGDWIVMAGGDGTVSKIIPKMVGSMVRFGLLPSGTANNIARALKITGTCQGAIEKWSDDHTRPFRVGIAEGSWGEKKFIEAVGWGIFPQLIKEMDERKEEKEVSFDSRQEEIFYAIRMLLEVLEKYSPTYFQIELEGEDLSGEYLAVEVMNIKCLGPNIDLASDADPGDDLLDLVLLAEKDREDFRHYLQQRLEAKEPAPTFPVRQGRQLQISWKGAEAHLDDDPMESDGSVEIKLLDQPVQFLALPSSFTS
jgi:diacylglycerol kinase (ATP)